MKENSIEQGVEYALHTDNELRLVALFGICFLAFLLAFIFLFVAVAIGQPESDLAFGLGMGLVLGTPVAVFYLLRRKLRRPVTVRLSADSVSIQRKGKSSILRKDDIKSYEAFFNDGETFDTETVIIRTNQGGTVKLQASTSSGSLKQMAAFRKDFEHWAEAQHLTQWSPWYRRKWGKGGR